MRKIRPFLAAALAAATLAACAPSTDKAPIEVCVDGTCDEMVQWYSPWCEAEALALTDEQKAQILTLDINAAEEEDRYLTLTAPFCEPDTSHPDGIYQCVAFPHPDSPTQIVVWAAELEDCDWGDGFCRVEDDGAAVCEDCFPGEEVCIGFNNDPLTTHVCSDDYEWVSTGESCP